MNAGKCPGNWIGIFFTLDFTLDFIFFFPTVEKYLHRSAEVGSSSESGHSLVLNADLFFFFFNQEVKELYQNLNRELKGKLIIAPPLPTELHRESSVNNKWG